METKLKFLIFGLAMVIPGKSKELMCSIKCDFTVK